MSATATTNPTTADTDAGAALARALVATILYYTPVTILSLSQIDAPRSLMMALYLLPFVLVPLAGLWRTATRRTPVGREFALSR